MKFMVMHKHDKKTETGAMPPPEFIAAMGALVGGMAQSGKLLDGAGLGKTANRSRVSLKGGKTSVQHGPYEGGTGGTTELPAAFTMVKVKSRDEAIAWATKLAPVLGDALGGEVFLEVGKVTEPWDLGLMEKPADAPEHYLIIENATPATEAGKVPNADAVLGVQKAMSDAGVFVSSVRLAPSSVAKRMSWRSGNKVVMDGPFAESKELVGGFALLELSSMEECLAFQDEYSTLMLTFHTGLEIDIRPL